MLTVISGICYSPYVSVMMFVMAGLVPTIHDFAIKQDADARHKAGHDAPRE